MPHQKRTSGRVPQTRRLNGGLQNAASRWTFAWLKPFFADRMGPGCFIEEAMMARDEQQNRSFVAKAAFPLLVLTAALQVYLGLSLVAYAFMGVPNPNPGFSGWIAAAMGAFQSAAAVIAFVKAARRDLRGTTLAVAGSLMLGWLSTLPSIVQQGFNFHGDDKVTPVYVLVAPLIAIAAATLAWRNIYPIAAALIASSMTVFGILVVLAFSIVIAMYGF